MRDEMQRGVRELGEGRWGLERARGVAREVETSEEASGELVALMFGEDGELRVRAADVARRVTERDAEPLWLYAEELAGLLAELNVGERRTRWHLGLVVARVAHTREQRVRAGQLMQMLAEDEGNVVRCSGIEGIALLACAEPTLRERAVEIVERALRSGTKAEMCRARDGRRMMEKAGIWHER